MPLDSLGYFGVRARNLDDWSSFGQKFLGLQLVDRSRKTLTFRMDDRRQRIVVHEDDVADGVARRSWAGKSPTPQRSTRWPRRSKLRASKWTAAPRATAEERRVKDLIAFDDPVGNRLEAFHGAEVATDPFTPGRAISGFRTGPLGMGHVVLNVESIDDVCCRSTRTRSASTSATSRCGRSRRISSTSIRGITASRWSKPARTASIT